MQISATIITFNEESNIKAACESVAWVDEIVVVDSNSTDRTCELAQACGARVISNTWPGFGAQKQFAVDQAQHEWIFSLDADERVSDELKNSIQSLIITRAPAAVAISRVASVEFESTTTISSAHATDSHAALIFGSSLKVMMVALIFIQGKLIKG